MYVKIVEHNANAIYEQVYKQGEVKLQKSHALCQQTERQSIILQKWVHVYVV
jgi:hypothetical protein